METSKRGNTGRYTVEGTLRGGLFITPKPSSYSQSQLSEYLARIGLPIPENTEIANGHPRSSLEYLERLIRLHMLNFPYENTALFYTQTHAPDIDPQSLYHRFVHDRKGSGCFGHTALFMHVLLALGYRAYRVSARGNSKRIPNPTEYAAIDHSLILVQPFKDRNDTYMVDVGSRVGLIRPMLLSGSEENILYGLTSAERFRLRRLMDPRSSLKPINGHKYTLHCMWVLEVQSHKEHSSTLPWTPLFSFSEEEFYDRDIANLSFTTRLHLDGGILCNDVVAIKYIFLDEGGNPILDAVMNPFKRDVLQIDLGSVVLIGRDVKLKYRGKSEIIATLKTEEERVAVLKEVFGIIIEDASIPHIQGLPCALDGPQIGRKAKL